MASNLSKGTHGGRIRGRADDLFERRRAKALRTAKHKGGEVHAPCRSYAECNHRKHGK